MRLARLRNQLLEEQLDAIIDHRPGKPPLSERLYRVCGYIDHLVGPGFVGN